MGAESSTERVPCARRASALEAEPPLCRGLRLARELRGEACGRERAAAMLDARIPTGGQGKGKSARRPFSSFQGRVTERVPDGTERPAPAAAASSSAREGAERPSREDAARLHPQWMNDQFQDLEARKRVRAADPPPDATPVEKANVNFRQNTFRVRPAHNPERFLNYVEGRPVVVFGRTT